MAGGALPAVAPAAELLHRVTAADPRLRLGASEALELAPLVTPWLERGLGPAELAAALLSGLPSRVHCAAAFLRGRLTRKLAPPVLPPLSPPPRRVRWYECAGCARPSRREGRCGACAEVAANGGGAGAADERA